MVDKFWQDKRVLLTGHTGFKGAWAALWLEAKGAKVAGLALEPEPRCLYNMLSPWQNVSNYTCDVRNMDQLRSHISDFSPEIVIHMAAQSLVRRSYRQPRETFEVNIMGTINLFHALLELAPPPQTILIITSDKVYQNNDNCKAFSEEDKLGGDDPYSASKACVELVTHSYGVSFFKAGSQLATARAGNVIGGGDWSEDRLIPDVFRSIERKEKFQLRNPYSTRPWQHVFDVLNGYFSYIEALSAKQTIPDNLNFGPTENDCVTTADIVKMVEASLGYKISAETSLKPEPFKEKQHLFLNTESAASALGWRAKLSVDKAIGLTTDWYRAFLAGKDMREFSLRQIHCFEELSHE